MVHSENEGMPLENEGNEGVYENDMTHPEVVTTTSESEVVPPEVVRIEDEEDDGNNKYTDAVNDHESGDQNDRVRSTSRYGRKSRRPKYDHHNYTFSGLYYADDVIAPHTQTLAI